MKYSNDKILLLGPYFGSWKEEIVNFRPFAKYVSETVECNKIIISSHYNRAFLYDWVDEFMPIEREYSKDELNQRGYIHRDLKQKDYFKKANQIKKSVCEKHDVEKKEVLHFNLPYIKNQSNISIYQKSFTPIVTDEERESLILYIPSSVEIQGKLEDLYDRLCKELNIIIIGDKKCYLQDQNILDIVDYGNNGYTYLLEYVNNAELVITPSSHWTFLANLQGVPVFSWGKFISPYKKGGVFNFANNNMVVTDLDNSKLIKQILYFKDKIKYK